MRSLFLVALSAFAGLLTAAGTAPAQPKKDKPLLVVDASRDAGSWWFPQLPKANDPAKPHQGKALADSLKKQGWDVIEIPKGGAPAEKLAGAKLVIRVGMFGDEYTKDDVAAYKDFVKGGTLVLFGNTPIKGAKPTPDAVAAEFGFEFGGDLVKANTAAWTNDPLVKGLPAAPFTVGTKIAKTPSGATPLANVGTDVVTAVAEVEKGRVFAYGSATVIIQNHASNKIWIEEPKKK